ncbi:MAG: DUF1761 domain-containing protein [Bacteroidota bacterium]
MTPNFLIILLASLVPLATGMIWYNKNVFGKAWMQAAEITEEKAKGANMPLMFGLTFLFSFFLAFAIQFMVIHQWSLYSILANEPGMQDPNSEVSLMLKGFLEKYGNNFRTFKHGAFHGTLAGFTIALPILGINALFERKGFKYIAINVGYWMLTMALMGGILCAFS